ncbi:hypothetical protein [Vibrio sp. SCSIO 43136]|uniref:hypothetical protein n=1 Tax=Vibrio sp. SCSIO 43136 TaxID=2819101 RepID=UPI002074CD46|nr:hypothetical protein [Vibrio sp. SCSIO 43136]USD67272.1 hypothetical protein J4N39_21815 [Vibrio sp. SCSIO 43136]
MTNQHSQLPEEYIEVISPADGKREDKVVLSTIAILFVIAAVLIVTIYRHDNIKISHIPKGLQQHLTSLSNSAEELILLSSIDGKTPTLDDLIDMGIEPFTPPLVSTLESVSWQQQRNCFLGSVSVGENQYQLRLSLSEALTAEVLWRPHFKESLDHACSETSSNEWFSINPHQLSNRN